MVRWSCICCVFLLFTEIITTLLQQFLDKFQNAFRDGDQRLSLSVTNNPLAPTGLSLLLLHVWRFSDTGCDHITCPTSGRHVREPFGKCLVHLANRVPKPGDGCTFGVGPCPRGSLGETLQVTPLVPLPTKLSSPWDRFVQSSVTDVKMAIFRPPREQEGNRRCDGVSGLSGRHRDE